MLRVLVGLTIGSAIATAGAAAHRSRPSPSNGGLLTPATTCESGQWSCWADLFAPTSPFFIPPINADVQPSTTVHYYQAGTDPLSVAIGNDGGPGATAHQIVTKVESTSDPSVATASVMLWGTVNGVGDLVSECDVNISPDGTCSWTATGDQVVTNVIVETNDVNAKVESVTVSSDKYDFSFSPKDWTRWSCYDPADSGLIVPPPYASQVTSPLFSAYAANFEEVLGSFMGQAGRASRAEQGTPMNRDRVQMWKNRVTNFDTWAPEYVFLNATQMCGAAYRDHILIQRAAGANTDAQTIVWDDVPGVPAVGAWVESVFESWWEIQNMVQGDMFGYFHAYQDKYNLDPIVTQNNDVMFTNFPMLVHFAHLLSTDFLRESRVHVGAALSGMLNFHQQPDSNFYPDPSKPLTWEVNRLGLVTQVVVGQAMVASFFIRSEKILRDRGVWSDSVDGIFTTDASSGRFTNDYLINMVNTNIGIVRQAVESYGLVEFLTDYTEFPVWALWTLPILLTYAPTQQVYDDAEWLYKIVWNDLSSHFSPSIGDSSGPSHRMSADYTIALDLGWEKLSELQHVLVLYPPMCHLVDSAGCAGVNAPTIRGISGDVSFTSVHSLVYRGLLAGGIGFHPFITFQDTFMNAPNRVVKQRFKTWRGQERYNFVADNYTIGTCGVDVQFFSQQITNVARLAGMPTSQPTQDPESSSGAAPLYPIFVPNMISIWTGSTDDPLMQSLNDAGLPDGIPGGISDARLLNYPISAQHQSFVLHTFMVADGGYGSQNAPEWFENPNVLVPPLLTDVLVPLGVDGLYINGVELPRAIGSCRIIPIDEAILTVRHGSASIVTRLLFAERSATSDIQDATSIQACPSTLQWGQYPNSVVWRVDNTTAHLNSGRLVIPHRNAGDLNKLVYRLAILQGGGQTKTDAERIALEAAISGAAVVTTPASKSSGWDTLSGVWYTGDTYCGLTDSCLDCSWKVNHVTRHCPENFNWTVGATISGPGGQIQLEVQRHDYYGGAFFYSQSAGWAPDQFPNPVLTAINAQYPEDARVSDSFWAPPITTTTFSRRVNGVEMTFPTGSNTVLEPVSGAELFEPHLPPHTVATHNHITARRPAGKHHLLANSLTKQPGHEMPTTHTVLKQMPTFKVPSHAPKVAPRKIASKATASTKHRSNDKHPPSKHSSTFAMD